MNLNIAIAVGVYIIILLAIVAFVQHAKWFRDRE